MWGEHFIQSYTAEKRKHRGTFVAAIWGDHLYCYGDTNTKHSIALSKVWVPKVKREEILGKPHGEPSLDLSEFCDFERIEKGKFHTSFDDMEAIKDDLLLQGVVPKVQMRNFLEIRKLETEGMTVVAMPVN